MYLPMLCSVLLPRTTLCIFMTFARHLLLVLGMYLLLFNLFRHKLQILLQLETETLVATATEELEDEELEERVQEVSRIVLIKLL